MKTFYVTSLLIFILSQFAFSNPIVPPDKIEISEIYFSSGGWVIEVVANDYYFTKNLDSVTIETSAGKAYFKNGISITQDQIILLTSDSLKTPLAINPAGDFIRLEEKYENSVQWTSDLCFGNHPEASCSAPFSGQSLSLVHGAAIQIGEWEVYEPSMVTKMNTPTLGTNPFYNSERDTIKGYIVDKDDNPVAAVKLEYLNRSYYDNLSFTLPNIITNSSGYFEGEIYSSYYKNAKVIINDSVYKRVDLKVELDSSNFYTIKVDNYFVDGINKLTKASAKYGISVFPNPVKNISTFEIGIPSIAHFRKAVIKIYNGSGQIVDILPVANSSIGNLTTVHWKVKDNLPVGEYIYSLEIDNKRMASEIMIISR